MQADALTERLVEEDSVRQLKRLNRSHSFTTEYRRKESSIEKKSNESAILNRVKRDRAMTVRADYLVDPDGKKSNIVTMVINFKAFYKDKFKFV